MRRAWAAVSLGAWGRMREAVRRRVYAAARVRARLSDGSMLQVSSARAPGPSDTSRL